MSSERVLTEKATPTITYKISITSIMTALVAISTIIVSVYIPASQGFFNIGEIMVYVSAILFGPLVGAIAGGFGSALADLLTGYVIYAPGTLVIKGLEGLIVGLLYKKMGRKASEQNLPQLWVIIASLIISILIFMLGIIFYTGSAEISGWNLYSITTDLTAILWIVLSLLGFVGINIAYKTSKNKDIIVQIVSIISGGMIMVVGYLLYATAVLGIVGAYFEIPFNILQVLIGLIGSIPLVNILRPRFIQMIL